MSRASGICLNQNFFKTLPRNKFKQPGTLFRRSGEKVPCFEKMAHPFYRMSKFDANILCMTELQPKLFGGNKVIPIRNWKSSVPSKGKEKYIDTAIEFQTVNGIKKWVNEFILFQAELDNIKLRQVDGTALELNMDIPGKLEIALQNRSLEAIIDESLRLADTSVAMVFTYLMKNNPENYSFFTTRLASMIGTHVFHIKDLEPFIYTLLQTLMKIESTKVNIKPLNNLLDTAGARLGVLYTQALDERIIEMLLAHNIRTLQVDNARFVLQGLLDNCILPSPNLLQSYLELIIKLTTSNNDLNIRSRRNMMLTYIDGFAPMLNYALTPYILDFLLEYCVHPTELFELINMAEKQSKEKLELFLQNSGIKLIRKVSGLGETPFINSANISTILLKYNKIFDNNLPNYLAPVFIESYLNNGNYSMAATLCELYGVPETFPSINKPVILENVLPGFSEKDRLRFIDLYSN